MKKILIYFLTAVLCIFSVTPYVGYAQENKEDTALKNLIIKVKQELNIPNSYDKFEYSIFNQGSKTTYNFDWKNTSTSESISLNVTPDGFITRYYYFTNGPYPSKRLPSISEETAISNAKKFIKSVNTENYNNIIYTGYKNVYDGNYQFFFIRTVNGVFFPSNYIEVDVNGLNGKITEYYPTWFQNADYESNTNILSYDTAFEQFKDKLGLKLAYKLDMSTKKLQLLYIFPYKNEAISATTGDKTYIYSNLIPYTSSYNQNKIISNNNSAQTEFNNMSEFLSKEQAEDKARTTLNISKDLKLQSIDLYKNDLFNLYYWSLSFNNPSANNDSVYVSLNAATGEIISFSKYIAGPDSSLKYDENQCNKIAQDFISKINQEKYAQIEKVDWDSNAYANAYPRGESTPTSYTFNYTRKVNGVYFLDNGVNITVDAHNGDITDYKLNWYNGDIPKADPKISLDDAYKVLYDNKILKLMYLTEFSPDYYLNGFPGYKDNTPKVKLVFSVISPNYCYIDANTGKMPNIVGSASYTEKCPYTDIKGCTAENQIKILYENGVYLDGNKFKPNDLIKQSDFLYLVCQLYSFAQYFGFSQTDINKIYNFLMNEGVITEKDIAPNKAITKQDAVKYIINALGYGRVAKYKDIFNYSFKDSKSIRNDCIGSAEIAKALKIVSGDYFNPNSYITRANAITLIYNSFNVNPINN